MEFNAATFEMVQNLAFPLIATLTGFDPAEWVGEQSELFIQVGDAFADVAARTSFLYSRNSLTRHSRYVCA